MNTPDDDFRIGALSWSAQVETAEDVVHKYLCEPWQNADGFLAFSASECRLSEQKDWQQRLPDLLENRVGQDDRGYLMEGGLWRRQAEQVYEELALEREGKDFFVQYWRLELGKDNPKEDELCYVREMNTLVRANLSHVFPERTLPAFEVIVPKNRLHFYMVRGK